MTTVAALREASGRAEFRGLQRVTFDLLLVVQSGRATHEVDFVAHELQAGDVVWVRTGQVQRWGDLAGFEGLVCLMSPDAFSWTATSLPRGADKRVVFVGANRDESVARQLRHLSESARDYRRVDLERTASAEALTMLVAATLLTLVAAFPAAVATRGGPHDEAFVELRRLIDRHFAASRSVAFYARRVGYSERTLNRIAHEYAGVAAKTLIDRRVALEAQRALADGDMPIARVAASVGFDDPAAFSKFFRGHVGQSPTEFRHAVGGAVARS